MDKAAGVLLPKRRKRSIVVIQSRGGRKILAEGCKFFKQVIAFATTAKHFSYMAIIFSFILAFSCFPAFSVSSEVFPEPKTITVAKPVEIKIDTTQDPNLLFADGAQTTTLQITTYKPDIKVCLKVLSGAGALQGDGGARLTEREVTSGENKIVQATVLSAAGVTADATVIEARAMTEQNIPITPAQTATYYSYSGHHLDDLSQPSGAQLNITGYGNSQFNFTQADADAFILPGTSKVGVDTIRQFIDLQNGVSPTVDITDDDVIKDAESIIMSVAVANSVNPKVLLATLEKEQSLVRGINNGKPVEYRLRNAMGVKPLKDSKSIEEFPRQLRLGAKSFLRSKLIAAQLPEFPNLIWLAAGDSNKNTGFYRVTDIQFPGGAIESNVRVFPHFLHFRSRPSELFTKVSLRQANMSTLAQSRYTELFIGPTSYENPGTFAKSWELLGFK